MSKIHVTPIVFDPAVSEECAQRAISSDLRRLRTDHNGTARDKYWRAFKFDSARGGNPEARATLYRRLYPERVRQ